MIEKVTLQMSGNGKFRTENGTGCDAMNPKTLMLYAAAQCSAQTALMIMQKERITPKRFEISYSGDLSAETVQSESVYRSFHVVYNVECSSEDDQAKVSRALELTHEKYCGMVRCCAGSHPCRAKSRWSAPSRRRRRTPGGRKKRRRDSPPFFYCAVMRW